MKKLVAALALSAALTAPASAGDYVLSIVISESPEVWTEFQAATGLDFETCNAIQRAVWANNGAVIVGTSPEGPIPSVDAYCAEPWQLERYGH